MTLKAWIKNDGQAFNHALEPPPLSDEQSVEYTEDDLILIATVHETIESR